MEGLGAGAPMFRGQVGNGRRARPWIASTREGKQADFSLADQVRPAEEQCADALKKISIQGTLCVKNSIIPAYWQL